jgi:Zn-dependent peptidase ImmA (M78 family)
LTPNPEALYKIACVLNVKIEDFFTKSRTRRLENISFRTGIEEAMIKLSKLENEVIEELELLGELEKLVKDPIHYKNPLEGTIISKLADVETAAERLRQNWCLGEGPISNVTDMLETNGICVIHKFSNYEFDGFSAFYKTRPVIVINTKIEEVTRRRFTAVHELSHIVLTSLIAENLSDRIEEICNAFAGALLLPGKILRKFWEGRKKFLMQDFINFKESFGISIQAIWIRAINLSLLTWNTFHKWKDAYEKQTNYGKFSGTEVPKRIESLLLRCLASGKLNLEKALEKASILKNNLDKTIRINMEFNLST